MFPSFMEVQFALKNKRLSDQSSYVLSDCGQTNMPIPPVILFFGDLAFCPQEPAITKTLSAIGDGVNATDRQGAGMDTH